MDSLWSIHYYHPFFSHFLCLLALWCPQQKNPLQCVVSSSSSNISCILSAGVRNYSPVYLLEEMTVKADRAELQRQFKCSCPNHSVSPLLGTFWHPWKASGSSSEGLWLEIWKIWVTSPGCDWCAPVLCTSVHPLPLQPLSFHIQSALHHCLSLLIQSQFTELHENILQGLQHCHIFHTVLLLRTKKILTSPGVNRKTAAAGKKILYLRRNLKSLEIITKNTQAFNCT